MFKFASKTFEFSWKIWCCTRCMQSIMMRWIMTDGDQIFWGNLDLEEVQVILKAWEEWVSIVWRLSKMLRLGLSAREENFLLLIMDSILHDWSIGSLLAFSCLLQEDYKFAHVWRLIKGSLLNVCQVWNLRLEARQKLGTTLWGKIWDQAHSKVSVDSLRLFIWYERKGSVLHKQKFEAWML